MQKTFYLYGSSDLSRKYVQSFFTFSIDIVDSGLNIIENEWESVFTKTNDGPNVEKIVKKSFTLFKENLNLFNTEYKCMDLLEKSSFYMAPEEISVGERDHQSVKRKTDGSKAEKCNRATLFLFPLRKNFKKVFEIPGVYDMIFDDKKKLESKKSIIINFV